LTKYYIILYHIIEGDVDYDTAIYIMEEFGSWESYCEATTAEVE